MARQPVGAYSGRRPAKPASGSCHQATRCSPGASRDRSPRRRGSRGSRPAPVGVAQHDVHRLQLAAAADRTRAAPPRRLAARIAAADRRRPSRSRARADGREPQLARARRGSAPTALADPRPRGVLPARPCSGARAPSSRRSRPRRPVLLADLHRAGGLRRPLGAAAGPAVLGASTPSASASSPDSNISVTMSQPPTSSPLDEQLRDRGPARELRQLLADAGVGRMSIAA